MNWDEYLNKTKKSNPRPLLMEALQYVTKHDKALDLGSGAMNDIKEIFNSGFKSIDAVDTNSSVADIAKDIVASGSELNFYLTSFEHFNYKPQNYDLINAQYSLPFTEPGSFLSVWSRITDSLLQDGIFAGNFFGTEDEWSSRNDMTFHSKNDVASFFSKENWGIIVFKEFRGLRKTARGEDKFWHIFDIIAKKRK